MKKSLRFISLLLMLCFIVVATAACAGEEVEESTQTSNETSEKKELFSTLPEKDYEKKTVTFLVPGDSFNLYKSAEIMAQEGSPEVLNDQIKRRNELVEERFNVVIDEIRTDDTQPMVTLVRNAVLSSLTDYDIVTPYIPDAAALALEDSFYLLNDLEYIDLNNSCWDQNMLKSLSINNKNYFATGDFSLLSLACTHAIVFNKDVRSTNNLEDPYELVNNGKWTIDKLREMASKITANVDGNTGMSNKDRYGFLINNNFVTSMYVGSGHSLTGKDKDDIPYISIIDEVQTAAPIFNKIFELVNDEQATCTFDKTTTNYYTSATSGGMSIWDAATESVANGLALFRAMSIIDILDLGEFDCNFGIIPIPKYNEEQEKYYSLVSTIYATAFAIPASCADSEMSSIIAQAMCEASTDTTKEAYVEVILKLRRIQDNESEAMLDKIFADRVYDLGIVYTWGGTNIYDGNCIGSFMNNVAYSGTQTFISELERITSLVESDLQSTLDAFE
jgi:hypothetical protein